MYKELSEALEKILHKMHNNEDLTPEEKEALVQSEELKAQGELLKQEMQQTWR